MKKIILSFLGLFAATFVAFGQYSYFTTNMTIGQLATTGPLSNVNRIVYGTSNSVWLIDSVTVVNTPVNSPATSPIFRLYDTWYPSNVWHFGSVSYTNAQYTNVIQYLTNWVTVVVPAPYTDPGAAGAAWTNIGTGGSATNWFTNTVLYSLNVQTGKTNFLNGIDPLLSYNIPTTASSAEFTGLNLLCRKGVLLNLWAANAATASNNVAITLKYREVFSPNRP